MDEEAPGRVHDGENSDHDSQEMRECAKHSIGPSGSREKGKTPRGGRKI